MALFLLLMILFTSIPTPTRAEEDRTAARRSYLGGCVRRQNPQFTADYDSLRHHKFVDRIKVGFDGLYRSSKCNRENETPKVSIRQEENSHWEQTKPAITYEYQKFRDLNPCATYRVHIDDSSVHDLAIGPYYKDNTPGKLVIMASNKEYEKNFTRASAITVTPKTTSANIKLLPICAKTIQLEVVPENDQRIEQVKLAHRHIDLSRPMTDIEFLVDELKPCTRYAVDLALSLETQNETELEEDNDVYRKEGIATFSTLPNLEELKNPGIYDNTSHFLSLNKSWEFLEQECAKPIFDQNPKFTLTISSRLRNLAEDEKGVDLRGEKGLDCGGIVSLTFSYDGVDPIIIFERWVQLNETVPVHCNQERKGLDFGGEKTLRGAQAVNESNQCLVQVEVIKENFWIQITIFMSSLVVSACTLFESIRMHHIVKTMKKSAMD